MKDPSPEKSLASADALFSLRLVTLPEDQKRIDARSCPRSPGAVRRAAAARAALDRKGADRHRSGLGPMLIQVLAAPISPIRQAAELLGKVGDETARNKGAGALIARAPKDKAKDKEIPELDVEGARHRGRSGRREVPRRRRRPARTRTRRRSWRARARRAARPAVLPFALKVAGDPKADKLVRDEMFGVIEGIGGLEAREGVAGIISSDREEIVRYRAFEVGAGGAKGRRDRSRARGVPRRAPATRRSTSTICWSS